MEIFCLDRHITIRAEKTWLNELCTYTQIFYVNCSSHGYDTARITRSIVNYGTFIYHGIQIWEQMSARACILLTQCIEYYARWHISMWDVKSSKPSYTNIIVWQLVYFYGSHWIKFRQKKKYPNLNMWKILCKT